MVSMLELEMRLNDLVKYDLFAPNDAALLPFKVLIYAEGETEHYMSVKEYLVHDEHGYHKDIIVVPKKTIKYITLTSVINANGATFNEPN